MITVDEILAELRERFEVEKAALRESRPHGVNTPGFNQDLGAHDALGEFLEWIEERL